jgi:NhaP-type Na+/H+ or K+/H+ antiporter
MLALEVILIGLAVVAVLAIFAQKLDIPYPVLLVLGGIVLGLAPSLPSVVFEPELVFLLFVPPLVFSAAWRASWQEMRANRRPIVGLAVGLVLTTMTVVAVVAYWLIPGMTWAVAFVLGAIVSDTDTTAVTAIAQRLRMPRQIVAILEGESLGNDATSLVAYRMAIAAVVAGTFSLGSAVVEFLFAAIVIVTVVLVRFVWMVGVTARFPVEPLPWNSVPLVAWAGMRGASTLVIALAVPLATNAGTAFPDRAMVIFLTFCVVVVTLIVQGLSLPRLIQRTGLQEDAIEMEVARTRAAAHAAAVRRLDELAGGKALPNDAARLRAYHERRAKQFAARSEGSFDQAAAKRAESEQQLRQELLQAERREIIDMHNRGDISDASLRAVLHDLDLEEQQGK